MRTRAHAQRNHSLSDIRRSQRANGAFYPSFLKWSFCVLPAFYIFIIGTGISLIYSKLIFMFLLFGKYRSTAEKKLYLAMVHHQKTMILG
jgi:hypothetical protein